MRKWLIFAGIVACAECNDWVPPPPLPVDDGQLPTLSPDASVATSGTVVTFAISRFFLGESARDTNIPWMEVPSDTAWQLFGYDLDGRTAHEQSTDVCTLAPGSPITNQDDGIDGTDNAAGSLLLPIIQGGFFLPRPSTTVSEFVTAGGWTLEIQIEGLTNDPNQTAVGLTAQVFVGAALESPPAFDPSDNWPVRPSSLADGMTIAGGATVKFSNVFVTNGVVVAEGASQALTIPLAMQGTDFVLPLQIHRVIVTFDHATPNTATYGTIAGVLDTEEVVRAFHILLGTCDALAGINQDLEQMQDILIDGTNAAGVPCNAISIGLGFNAKLIGNPTLVGADPSPPTDSCDAGLDASSSD